VSVTQPPLRAFLRRFREACATADINIYPVTIRLDQRPPANRPEPRIVSGHITVSREPKPAREDAMRCVPDPLIIVG
jgi:hypothetical protein